MTGTLFKFSNDEKVAILEAGQTSIRVQVDNDALLDKYQFVWDHAPQMWLSEKDNGFWPLDLQTFFDNVEGVSHHDRNQEAYIDNRSLLMLTTRIPLTGPYDTTQEWLHGKRPHNGESVPIHTFIFPTNATD